MKLLSQINDPSDIRRLPQSKLQPLADEIREYMIETLSKIGGHTGASLGPVELIIALHYALETPRDKLVIDIGHQAYAHKILTGRRDQFPTIRQYNGLSGFCAARNPNTTYSMPPTPALRFRRRWVLRPRAT